MSRLAGFVLVFSLASWVSFATTYRVGPGLPYQTLQQVAPLLNPGDTLYVDGDQSYTGGIIFTRAGTATERIIIAGVKVNGNRPVIAGNNNFQSPALSPLNHPSVGGLLDFGTIEARSTMRIIDIGAPEFDVQTEVVDISRPPRFVLWQDYPHPFNPSTRIDSHCRIGVT
jgi:hypothetical protein